MNKLVCVVLLFCSIVLNAQTKEDSVYKEKKYSNGNLMYKGYFLNGRPVGEFIRYYPHGAVKAKMNYTGNVVYADLYNEKGQLYAKGMYLDKQKDSTWLYFKNKVIVGREDYRQGLIDGVVSKYFLNGNIADTKKWKNGKKDGLWERYYREGKIKSKGFYKEGKLHGKFISYTESGKIDIEGFFKNNLRDGTWCFYNSEGEFLFKVDYKKGVPENLEELEKKENEYFIRLKNSELNFIDPQEYIDSPEEYMIRSRRSGK